MKKVDETVDSSNVERSIFELKLPNELDIKPWVAVELPRNKQALVYKLVRSKYDRPGYADAKLLNEAVVYDVYIISKKSLAVSTDGYTARASQSFDDLPSVKHYLYNMVAHLSIKRKTIKKVNVVDLQDDDDE